MPVPDFDLDRIQTLCGAITNAITLASTDKATHQVTFRQNDILAACAIAMARALVAAAESVAPPAPDALRQLVSDRFAAVLDVVLLEDGRTPLDAGMLGFTTRTLV